LPSPNIWLVRLRFGRGGRQLFGDCQLHFHSLPVFACRIGTPSKMRVMRAECTEGRASSFSFPLVGEACGEIVLLFSGDRGGESIQWSGGGAGGVTVQHASFIGEPVDTTLEPS
jgi:hypothetical protein